MCLIIEKFNFFFPFFKHHLKTSRSNQGCGHKFLNENKASIKKIVDEFKKYKYDLHKSNNNMIY